MKNKGELLIESLLSLLIISICLIPISTSIYNSFRYMKKTNKNLDSDLNNKNFVEYLKSVEYKKIIEFSGSYNFKNIKEACRFFDFNEEYFLDNDSNLTVNIKIRNEIEIIRDDKKEKIYLLDIKVGDYEDIYIPE